MYNTNGPTPRDMHFAEASCCTSLYVLKLKTTDKVINFGFIAFFGDLLLVIRVIKY